MAFGGPCVIFAPVVMVAFVLAIPLWPVAIAVVGLMWCVTWALERLMMAFGGRANRGWTANVTYWFVLTLKPWYYFDPPSTRAERRARFGGTTTR